MKKTEDILRKLDDLIKLIPQAEKEAEKAGGIGGLSSEQLKEFLKCIREWILT